MSNLYRGLSIDASYQVSYDLAKRFQRKSCFRNRPIRNKNCLWCPCLLTDQNGMSNSHIGPSIDASYHVSVHLAKLFQGRRFFRNQPIRNKIFFLFFFICFFKSGIYIHKKAHTLPPDMDVQGFTT